jgi:hypothetical protein
MAGPIRGQYPQHFACVAPIRTAFAPLRAEQASIAPMTRRGPLRGAHATRNDAAPIVKPQPRYELARSHHAYQVGTH